MEKKLTQTVQKNQIDLRDMTQEELRNLAKTIIILKSQNSLKIVVKRPKPAELKPASLTC